MRSFVFLVSGVYAVLGGAFLLVACGGTTGTDPTNPLASREPAASGIDSPSSGSEPAPPSTENAGVTGGSKGSLPQCRNPVVNAAGCEACLENSCGTALANTIASCGPFLSCSRNCDCSDDACLSACAGAVTSACETAASPLGTCVTASCDSACGSVDIRVGPDAGAGSGSGTGVVVQPGGGCSGLSTCCTMLSGAAQVGCQDVVATNDATACKSELDELEGIGSCN